MLKKRLELISLLLFYVLGLALYIVFIVNDFNNMNIYGNIYIKYGVVISSLSFASLSILFIKDKNDIVDISLLVGGLIFTLISDYFLLVVNDKFEVGVSTFIFAQLCYFVRYIFINKYNKNQILLFSTIRIVTPVVGIIVLAIINELSLLYVLVVIYFIQLVMNFVEGLIEYINSRKIDMLILSIAFLLFIGCDICVGLANIGYNSMYNISWIFYAPSQILIGSHFVLRKLYEKDL